MTKREIREVFIQKRLSLSDQDYKDLSRKLCVTFFTSLDLEGVNSIHTYLPLKRKKEPDTWPIIEHLRKKFPDIQIIVPAINQRGEIASYLLKEDEVKEGYFGIMEPNQDGPSFPHDKLDVILVPLLAVDLTGHRIGYGKGHYDHFLASCKPKAKKVGLSFFDPIPEIKEIFEHDVPLDGCITPNGFVSF